MHTVADHAADRQAGQAQVQAFRAAEVGQGGAQPGQVHHSALLAVIQLHGLGQVDVLRKIRD